MKRIINYIFFPVMLLIISSCSEDFLEKENPQTVTTESFFKTKEDFTLAINGAYNVLMRGDFTEGLWKIGDMRSDDTGPGDDIDYVNDEGAKIDNFTDDGTSYLSLNFWMANYVGISRSNTVISRLKSADLEESVKLRFEGEARFLRAIFYFYQVRAFGDVPMMTEEVVSQEQLKIGRTDYKKIYSDIIVPDLVFASKEEVLPSSRQAPEVGRATKWAAKALLAKVYLTMASYDSKYYTDCRDICQSIINEGPFALEPDFRNLFTTRNENGMESIFEIQYVAGLGSGWKVEGWGSQSQFRPQRQHEGSMFNNTFGPRFQGKKAGRSGANFFFAYDGYGFNIPTTSSDPRQGYIGVPYGTGIVEAFSKEDSIRSKRSILNYRKAVIDSGYAASLINENISPFNVNKYTDFQNSIIGESDDNYYLMRLADVYLMYAEAENEVSGPSSNAYQYVNLVRKRAGLPDLPQGLTRDQFLEAVYKERRLEFAFEGQRWFDLIRRPDMCLNIMKAQGKTNISIERLLLPIPIDVIDKSEGRIAKNPGY